MIIKKYLKQTTYLALSCLILTHCAYAVLFHNKSSQTVQLSDLKKNDGSNDPDVYVEPNQSHEAKEVKSFGVIHDKTFYLCMQATCYLDVQNLQENTVITFKKNLKTSREN